MSTDESRPTWNPSQEWGLIAKNTRYFREQAGLTQEQVAEKAGIPVRTVQRIEAGTPVREEALVCVAQVLATTPELLRMNYDNPPPELRGLVEDFAAMTSGTGPWCHIPVKRIQTPLEVEEHLLRPTYYWNIATKDPGLSPEALDLASSLLGEVEDFDVLHDLPAAAIWDTAKSFSEELSGLDALGGAMMAGTLQLTHLSKNDQGTVKSPGPCLLVYVAPVEAVKPTLAYDLRNLPACFLERNPKTWTPSKSPFSQAPAAGIT